MRNILTFKEADELLSPYYEKIMNCMDKAFNTYISVRKFLSEEEAIVIFKNRTKACVIHDLIKANVTTEFSGIKGITINEWRGVFGILINNSIFIRFKKMNTSLSISNAKTKQNSKFIHQQQLEGFPATPTFVYAGYIPDLAWNVINGYHLACFSGGLNWYYDMQGHSVEQLSLELKPTEVKPQTRRVKPKKENKPDEKTGTEG